MVEREGKVALETDLQPLSPILFPSKFLTNYEDKGIADSSSCPSKVTAKEEAQSQCELSLLCITEIDGLQFVSLLRTESDDILLLHLIIGCVGGQVPRLKASWLILASTLIDPNISITCAYKTYR